jgi:hypothetical protein
VATSMKSRAGWPEWIMNPSCAGVSSVSVIREAAYGELHALGARGAQLSAHDDLATLGSALHDEAKHAVAGPPHGQAVQQLVAKRLALRHSREAAVLDLGGIEGDGAFGEFEALLDQRRELADAAALLAEDLLGVRGADDDVRHRGGGTQLHAGVTLLGEFSLEELIELRVEDTVLTDY